MNHARSRRSSFTREGWPRRHEGTKTFTKKSLGSLSRCITCCARNHETAKPRNRETSLISQTRVRRAGLRSGPARTVDTDGGRNRIRRLAVTSVVRVDRSSAAPRRASNSTTPSATRAFPAFVPSCLRGQLLLRRFVVSRFVVSWFRGSLFRGFVVPCFAVSWFLFRGFAFVVSPTHRPRTPPWSSPARGGLPPGRCRARG